MQQYQVKPSYRKTNPSDWTKIKDDVLRIETHHFKEYPEELCEDEESFGNVFANTDTIAYIAELDGVIGYIAGLPASHLEEFFTCEDGGYENHFEKIGGNSMYLYAFGVDENRQNQGIGSTLVQHFIDESKRQGYKSVSGHFSPNASAHIMAKHNPQVGLPCPNYKGSGETYMFYKLDL